MVLQTILFIFSLFSRHWCHHWCQLAAVKKTRLQADSLSFWVLGRLFGKIYIFYKFLGGVFSGNTRKICAGVYNMASRWYILEVMYCTNNMFSVLFMYQQYVYGVASRCPLVVYELYILCYIFDYKNIFEYRNIFYRGMRWAWVNQHSMHLHIVTLSKMLRLGWWLPYIENTSWIAYISLQWQL